MSNPQRLACLMRLGTLAAMLAGALLSGAAGAAEDSHRLANHAAPAAQGGDFTLTASTGPVSLKQFRGKLAVLYFGYTLCPDACPTTLASLTQALKQLTPAELARVQPLVITLDPARDKLPQLDTYVRFFHPSIIGLSGGEAQIATIAHQYGVLYARQTVDSATHYVIDHSSFLSLVGPEGKLLRRLPHGTAPDDIAAALRAALAGPAA